jgi:hypothetical protein
MDIVSTTSRFPHVLIVASASSISPRSVGLPVLAPVTPDGRFTADAGADLEGKQVRGDGRERNLYTKKSGSLTDQTFQIVFKLFSLPAFHFHYI